MSVLPKISASFSSNWRSYSPTKQQQQKVTGFYKITYVLYICIWLTPETIKMFETLSLWTLLKIQCM